MGRLCHSDILKVNEASWYVFVSKKMPKLRLCSCVVPCRRKTFIVQAVGLGYKGKGIIVPY